MGYSKVECCFSAVSFSLYCSLCIYIPVLILTALLFFSTFTIKYRNGTFPQHLILQLDHPSRLQQLQLLSHEFKIAGKIELQVASSNEKPHEFTRLGFLSFDPNDRTSYSARELKSVTLPDVETTALKLIIHRIHANALNTSSQACLIMVNLVGEPLQQASTTAAAATNTTTATNKMASIAPVVISSPPAPLTNPITSIKPNFTSSDEDNVDEVTAQRISELQEKKAAAVAIEDYDEAKKLKAAIEKLRAVGAKMAALEARKKAAVDEEDYDTAKALKIELERMRHRAYAAIAKGEHHHHHPDVCQYDTAVNTSSSMDRLLSPVQQATQQPTDLPNNNNNNTAAVVVTTTTNTNAPFSPSLTSMDSYGSSANRSPELNGSLSIQKPTTSSGNSEWRSYDERPARAAGTYDFTNFEEFNADSAPPGAKIVSPKNRTLRRIDSNAEHGNNTISAAAAAAGQPAEATAAPVYECPPAPPGFPSELPLPEPLSQDDAKEAGPIEALVGPFLTRCLYSKSWQLKEAGMTAIATAVGTSFPDALPRLDGDGDALRLLCGVVAQGLKARIPAIAAAALVLLESLVKSAASRRLPPRDLHAALTELLPLVAERAGDPQVRTREQAVEALVEISRVKESGLKALTGIFLKPYKITESPKITQGRLHLVSALLGVLGVVPSNSLNNNAAGGADATALSPSGSGSGGSGFTAESVVQYCCPALKSANAEVRSAAAELVVKVGRAPGVGAHVVLPLLPFDVNPKLKQQLEEHLTGEKRIKARPGSNTNNATARNTNSSKMAAGGVPAPKSAANSAPSSRRTSTTAGTVPSRSQASSRQHTSSTNTAHAPVSAAGARTSQPSTSPTTSFQQQQQRQDEYEYNYNNSHQSSLPTAGGTTTTSMPPPPKFPNYPNQQALSPSLPQEDTSSILYTPSVVGPEFSVADEDPAPFEEELRRREATLGPSHPSVAEAASNLAIIYNQRGDGARALPLYQRALNIWEMTHGPHHPDVAHALTDIAVILLEAGHDVQGKQLLRRALGIQMELLGPMHPDVIAIKDVLDE
jgi:centrosomal protein CEP104